MASSDIQHCRELHPKVIEAIKECHDSAKVKEWFRNGHFSIGDVDTSEGSITFNNGISRNRMRIDRRGMTALHYAALYSKIDIIKFLLKNGADPSLKNGNQTKRSASALQIAINSDCADSIISKVVAELCVWFCGNQRKHLIIGTSKDTEIPVLLAIQQNLSETLETLLHYGADPEGAEQLDMKEKARCLRYAVVSENGTKILDTLLQNQIWNNPQVINCRYSGITALHRAVTCCSVESVKTLIKHGADPCIADDNGTCPIHDLVGATDDAEKFYEITEELKKSINKGDSYGRTPLHLAVMRNNCEFVGILRTRFNADFKLPDAKGKRPLHYLSYYKKNEDLVDLLVETKEDLDVEDNPPDSHTPFYYAIQRNDHNLVQTLLTAAERLGLGIIGMLMESGALSLATRTEGTDEDFADMLKVFDLTCKRYCISQSNNITWEQTLIKSVKKEGIAVVQWLIRNQKNEDDKTLLQLALEMTMFSRIGILLKYGADPKGQRLLHQAVIADCSDNEFEKLVKMLIQKESNFDIDEKADNKTALHCSMDAKRFSRAKILLQHHANPSTIDDMGRNALHYAFRCNAPHDVIKEIVSHKHELDKEDVEHKTPLQYLSVLTKLSSVKALTSVDQDDEVKQTDVYSDVAMVDVNVYLDERNPQCLKVSKRMCSKDFCRQASALYGQSSNSVEIVDFSDAIEDDGEYEFGDKAKFNLGNKETVTPSPLEQAIELKRFDVVQVLLVKGAEVEAKTLEHAILNNKKELAHILVRHAKDIKGPLLSKPKQGSSKITTLFRMLIDRMPDVAKEALDRCVIMKDKSLQFDYSYIHYEWSDLKKVGLRPRKIADKKEEEEEKVIAINPIQLMVKKRRIELLQHPIVWSYLYRKWNYLGIWFYLAGLALYLCFVGLLSIFVLTVNDPQSEFCNLDVMQNESISPKDGDCGPFSKLVFTYVLSVLVILLATVHLFIEGYQIFYSPIEYVMDPQNYVQLPLFITSIGFVFIFPNQCGCTRDWQWQLGIFVVFFGWINLVIFASKFPSTGTYVLVFWHIAFTTFQVFASFSIILVAASSLILFMMFNSPAATTSSFSNVGISFVKTVTMVTGELGFEQFFNLDVPPSEYVPIPYFGTNFIVWIFFLILVPVVLNNMLTSLAVDDAKEVLEGAKLGKLILQVHTVVAAERVVPDCVKYSLLGHVKFDKSDIQLQGYWNKIKLAIFGGKNYLQDLEHRTECYTEERTLEQKEIEGQNLKDEDNEVLYTLEQVQQRLEKLSDLVKGNDDQIRKCQKQLRSMALTMEKRPPK